MQIDWIVFWASLFAIIGLPCIREGEFTDQPKWVQYTFEGSLSTLVIVTILMIIDSLIWDIYP